MSERLSAALRNLGVDLERLDALRPSERMEAERELLALEGELARNPLLGYEPHAKQVEFHSPPFEPLRAFFGGNRSGKTTCVVVDSIIQAIDRDLVPAHLQEFKRWDAPFYCRFVTPDLTNTLEGVLLQKIREWCPKEQLKGGSFDRAWDKGLRLLKFKNGSWWQFFSNDQDRDKFGGAALHRVVFDEEPHQVIRQECLMRLIDYGGEELFAMTPLMGMSWLFDEVYEPWERGELEGGRVVLVDMDDNPHLDQYTMRRVLKGLTSEEREARKSGRFVHFAGLIYPEFRLDRHRVPQAELPESLEIFCGIDPGYRHMAAVVYCYLDLDDRMVVFDELALQRATVRDVCREIFRVNRKWGVQPRWYVIDPASRNKNNQTGRNDQQEFADHGIVTIPGQNAVLPGINRVKERLQADKLQVSANCHELLGEFKRYRWASPIRGENDAKEAPVKRDDHLLDALRYVCMQRPLPPPEQLKRRTETMKDRLLRQSLERLRRPKVPESEFGPGMWA